MRRLTTGTCDLKAATSIDQMPGQLLYKQAKCWEGPKSKVHFQVHPL